MIVVWGWLHPRSNALWIYLFNIHFSNVQGLYSGFTSLEQQFASSASNSFSSIWPPIVNRWLLDKYLHLLLCLMVEMSTSQKKIRGLLCQTSPPNMGVSAEEWVWYGIKIIETAGKFWVRISRKIKNRRSEKQDAENGSQKKTGSPKKMGILDSYCAPELRRSTPIPWTAKNLSFRVSS